MRAIWWAKGSGDPTWLQVKVVEKNHDGSRGLLISFQHMFKRANMEADFLSRAEVSRPCVLLS